MNSLFDALVSVVAARLCDQTFLVLSTPHLPCFHSYHVCNERLKAQPLPLIELIILTVPL